MNRNGTGLDSGFSTAASEIGTWSVLSNYIGPSHAIYLSLSALLPCSICLKSQRTSTLSQFLAIELHEDDE